MRVPIQTVVQFSDVHIVPDGRLLYDLVDTHARLRAALTDVEESGIAPAALLFTGDLAESGDLASYRRLRQLVDPVAARLGVPALYAMGNHDARGAFRAGLLGEEASAAECDAVHDVDGFRVIVLDSTDPGQAHGVLTDRQLDWLSSVLSEPAKQGTLLALHHPPIASPLLAAEMMTLHQHAELAEVIQGSDVRLIAAGHAHHATAGVLAGVPVWIASSTAYSTEVLGPGELVRGTMEGGYTRIDVYEHAATATYIPITRGAPCRSERRRSVRRAGRAATRTATPRRSPPAQTNTPPRSGPRVYPMDL